MSDCCKCGCFFTWLSGLFAAPAICHLVRIIMKWDVMLGGKPVEMKTSWMIFVAGAVLAAIFGIVGCRKSHADKGANQASSCC